MRLGLCLLFAFAVALPVVAHAGGCPPPGWDKARLQALKAARFEIGDDAARNRLANGLLDCLASPDPQLRDGIGFEAWQTWLRGGRLDEATRRAALARLQSQLAGTADRRGF